jgi:hypothetical protein
VEGGKGEVGKGKGIIIPSLASFSQPTIKVVPQCIIIIMCECSWRRNFREGKGRVTPFVILSDAKAQM